MTRVQIAGMIEAVGLPFAYDHFTKDEAPSGPPYICFLYPSDDDFIADNRNYQRISALRIELYTDNKDFDLEARLEAVLDAAELPYDKEGSFIESERMYMQTYTTEVYINADN